MATKRHDKKKHPGSSSSSGSSGGFEWRDRSGKVHRMGGGGGGGGGASSKPSSGSGGGGKAKGFEVPTPDQMPRGVGKQRAEKFERPERKERFEKKHRKDGPRRRDERSSSSKDSRPFKAGKVVRATVDKNQKGFAFLITPDKNADDIYVPPHEAAQLFHGDRVEVKLAPDGSIRDLRVLEHRFREIVGRFSPHHRNPNQGWVIYERKRAREEVFIQVKAGEVKPGDWLRVKLTFGQGERGEVTGDVVEVYGAELPASADIVMISAEHNLVEEHPADAVKEAESFTLDISSPWRKDLRNVPFITIDGETARDFDDAVFVERMPHGYTLWVAIADVSHYVTEGSALDRDSRGRGTSVYFPERAFHMLPRALSENLCSLKPYEPRLALVAVMDFDQKGDLTHTEVMEATIQSQRRATYTEIQAEWNRHRESAESLKGWEYAPHFELYHLLRKSRHNRGSIDFDLPEAEIRVAPDGVPISIKKRERWDSHRLIEEFMIIANEAVTQWMMARNWPFIYRIHEEPAETSIAKLQKLLRTVGVAFALDEENLAESLSDLSARVSGHPAEVMLNTALLRSMKQAVYSSVHNIHFGLASEGYTHFTSPIRRYPDLIVHRLLRQVLRLEGQPDSTENRRRHKTKRTQHPVLSDVDRKKLDTDLEEIADHCSYRERMASDSERESIKLKQIRMMLQHLGDEFRGKIIGMVDSGLFIEVEDPYCEGMIPKDTMGDDFYEYNEERMIFYGRRKRRTFHMGDQVKIRVLRADIERRQVDFELLEHYPRSKTPGEERVAAREEQPRGRGDKKKKPHREDYFKDKGRRGKKKGRRR